jgi:hypothetical protein
MLIAIAVVWVVGMVVLCSVAWFELTRSSRSPDRH